MYMAALPLRWARRGSGNLLVFAVTARDSRNFAVMTLAVDF
jgi:hypothetical protein